MTTTFFEEDNLQALLEKIAKDEGFEHPTYSIENGSKPGQNYIGRIFRVVITENQDDNKKSLSLIFKASSTNRARQDTIGGDMFFRKEKNMYEIILPTLNDFLKKHGLSDHTIFPGIPRCLATEMNYATSDKSDVIVLEDKKVQGFEVVDFKTGLNGEQCRLALRRVALLHASSMALSELEPETAEQLRSVLGGRPEDAALFEELFKDLKRSYIAGLELLEDPYIPGNPTYDSLHKVLDNFMGAWIARFGPPDVFTITHTDLTSNNIMFKLSKDGSTEDACIIDFQTGSCTSVVNDLATLLLFSVTKEVRDEHFENLLQFYFDEVTKTLRAFGCDADKLFPLDSFQKQLQTFMKFGVWSCILALPVVLADSSEITGDIHSKESGASFFADTVNVKNPETIKLIKRRLKDVVSDAERLGYI